MSLEERVARLERQNRRLKRFAWVGCIGALTGLIVGADAAQSGNRLQLVDGTGRVRIDLQVHPDWGPMMSLRDFRGAERLRVGSDENADGRPFIWFFDRNERRVKSFD